MGNRPPIDEDDPLAGAPDEVIAAFIALGGHATRVRDTRMMAEPSKRPPPVNAASQLMADAAKLTLAAPRKSAYLNRKV